MSEIEDQGLKNYKTIIIGRSAVGKSTLLIRYVDSEFNPQKPTIGIDYRFKKVTHQDASFNLELWDSAGQERYRTIVYNYFTLSKAGVIVFDLTNEDSLNDAKNWLQQLVNHCGNEIPKILLGNKSDLLAPADLHEKLEKYKDRINELKTEYNCEFFTVSAKTGENVNEAFNYLVREIYNRNKATQPEAIKPSPGGFKLKSTYEPGSKIEGSGKKKKENCC
jgi:small GTP-binding protein